MNTNNSNEVVQTAPNRKNESECVPFPMGLIKNVGCRVARATKAKNGSIILQLHNSDGYIDAHISRPDFCVESFYKWECVSVDVVTTRLEGIFRADILNISFRIPSPLAMLQLLPRAACAWPEKLDELMHLVQTIRCPELKMIIGNALSNYEVFMPFLSQPGGVDSYAYPGGLLARTVDAVKYAAGIEFESDEEHEVLMTAALLYDIGRVRDSNPMSDSLRIDLGFVPHPKTMQAVAWALDARSAKVGTYLREILTTGYCDRYPSFHSTLWQASALAQIDSRLRVKQTKV